MILNQKKKFSLPAGVTYLNGAYMSPLLKSVERAGIEGIKEKRDPSTVPPSAFFDGSVKLRRAFAQLINVRDENRIAIVAAASYGLASVARNLNVDRSHNMIIAGEQFPSNVYPWMGVSRDTGATLRTVSAPSELPNRGKIWNERILDAIDRDTRLVALGHVHWADGTMFDLMQIRKRTRDVGALLVVDGTQSVGALPFDVARIQPDALICSGYKWLMGPYAIGLAYFGEYFDQGRPIEESWLNRKNSENFSGLVRYDEEYQSAARRYEVGEHSNFILVPMMEAALQQVNAWKPAEIQSYSTRITGPAVAALRAAGCWIEDDAFRSHHLFGLRLPPGSDFEKMRSRLRDQRIAVSVRGDAFRISAHVYNSASDLKKLVRALTVG